MLGIGHMERKERSTTPSSMVERSTYRQSWSSDEPSSSSSSGKGTKSLWNKLRRRTSRIHISQSEQPGRSSVSYQQGSYPYTDMNRSHSGPQTTKPVVSGTSVSVQRPMQSSHLGGARSSMLWAATDNAKQSEASARHQSLVPGLERLKTLSVLGSETNVSVLKSEENAQVREPAGLGSVTLPSNKPRSNSYIGAVDALKKAPAMSRVSTDVYRSSGQPGDKRQAPAHSYSMDIPRSSSIQPSQQRPLPPVDHKNADNISAESIQRMLGEYTGKSADVKGKPRLRRLMMFPGGNKQQASASSQDRIIELSLGGSGLERIAEDEEQQQQQHSIQKRTGANNYKTKLVFDEPESVLPSVDRDSNRAPYQSRGNEDAAQRRSQIALTRSLAAEGTALDYKSDAKRFSENSGSTVSSGETLETHSDHDGAAVTKSSMERFPNNRPAQITPPKRSMSTQVVQNQQQPQKRPPRLSFSNGGSQQRPKAIYNDGSSLVPSPTKEHPPKLIPIVHGQVAEKEFVLDPTVYRNTFFNARPVDEQKELETVVLNRTGRLSSGESTKFLVRSVSDDTLNSSNGGDTTAVDASARVRFSGNHDYIPDYYLDPDNAPDGDSEACTAPAGPSHAPTERSFSASMPTMMASTSAHDRNELADPSDLRRRPSEPIPSSSKAAMSSAASTGALGKGPANHNRSSSVAEQEVEVLRRTIRILQSRNDMLSELVGLNPMDAVSDSVKTHIRTVELENVWLHRELAKRKQTMA